MRNNRPTRNSRGSKMTRRARNWTTGIASFCFGILIGVIPNLIATPQILLWAAPILGTIAFLASVISLLLRQQSLIEASIRCPQAMRSQDDETLYARKGFIGFVSLYNNPGKLTPEELQVAIASLNFKRLQLENSNLQPMLYALKAHASQLQHCWLIATIGSEAPGSLPYARVIAEYLRQCQGVQCTFHYGNAYALPLDDDTDVLQKTYDLLTKRIFREAVQLNLLPQDLVADFTAGLRSMTLGMVLACLDKERDIEFVGTRYDHDAKPTGGLTPIVFSFEPEMKSNDR